MKTRTLRDMLLGRDVTGRVTGISPFDLPAGDVRPEILRFLRETPAHILDAPQVEEDEMDTTQRDVW